MRLLASRSAEAVPIDKRRLGDLVAIGSRCVGGEEPTIRGAALDDPLSLMLERGPVRRRVGEERREALEIPAFEEKPALLGSVEGAESLGGSP
jgi:hypothetical protein